MTLTSSELEKAAAGSYVPLAVTYRSDVLESVHHGAVVALNEDGSVAFSYGDPLVGIFPRSSTKPLQAHAMLSAGLDLPDELLALVCASHDGRAIHLDGVRRILASVGLDESALQCALDRPLGENERRAWGDNPPTRIAMNCSGKHAAMLARAVLLGEPTSGYEDAAHAVQRAAHDTVATWSGMTPEQLGVGVDGCGVTVFSLPLANMALSYARLAHASTHGDEPSRRILHAMTSQPFLVGGSDRFDTRLMEAVGGNVVCKVGAEGVHTFAIIDRGIGFALKVEDGSQRAQFVAVLAMLAEYDGLPSPLPESLREAAVRVVRNTRGEQVGEVFVSSAPLGAPACSDVS
mgnify:CR=1 FL=1